MCKEKLDDAPQMDGRVQIDESLFRGKDKWKCGRLLLGNRYNTGDSGTNSSDDLTQTIDNRNYGNTVDSKTSFTINRNSKRSQFI